jgi:hypothetical protein
VRLIGLNWFTLEGLSTLGMRAILVWLNSFGMKPPLKKAYTEAITLSFTICQYYCDFYNNNRKKKIVIFISRLFEKAQI